MDDLFRTLDEEMPGYLAAAVGSLSGGPLQTHASGALDLAEAEAALTRLAVAWRDLYDGLGGPVDLGSDDELLMSASRSYLLVKVSHPHDRFVAVLLSSNGNIGYLRFRMRTYLRRVVNGQGGAS